MAEIPMKLLVDVSTGEEKMVPLSPEEIAQREKDQAAAAAQAAADAATQATNDAFVAKLAAGTASGAEVQQALALVLGGSDVAAAVAVANLKV